MFQSRVGFSLRRDTVRVALEGSRSLSCFNPVLGFLSAATLGVTRGAPRDLRFQSRVGFSLRRDVSPDWTLQFAGRVSIPCWVFSPPRLSHPRTGRSTRQGFNPVLGFLSAATGPPGDGCRRDTPFQSRVGFFLRRDATRRPPLTGRQTVSIPCWVFSPPRRTEPRRIGAIRFDVSIPCWVFSPPRQGVQILL